MLPCDSLPCESRLFSPRLTDPNEIRGRPCSLLLAGESSLTQNNLVPLARVVATHEVGCDPAIMGIGPADAIRGALRKAGLKLADMDLVEVHPVVRVIGQYIVSLT